MKSWNFSISVMFGKCDGSETEIDYDVTDDQYKILEIASKNDLDFDDIDELIETLKTFDLEKYKENIISIEECDVELDDIKKINFETLDFESLQYDVESASMEQELDSWGENFGDEENEEDNPISNAVFTAHI